MKIAIVRKKYTFHGGAEGFSGSLIENLADGGHEIHIFAIKWQADTHHANIHFHKVPSLTFISFLRDLTFAVSSYFILHKHRKDFDIIQSHDKTLYQDIYRAGDGCHIEWLKHRWKRIGPGGKLSIVFNPYHMLILVLERCILTGRRFKKIIAISEMVKRNITDNYKVPPDDIEIIYNGVDLEKFNPANKERYRGEIRQKYGIEDSGFVILFAGSGFERKGARYLLEAVKSLDEPVTVLIAGKGKRMKGDGAGRARIIFCGPRKDLYKYYAAADIFVFPTMYEPFGNVHLEALASGLPVITTRESGASEIIIDGVHGFVADAPEDVASIAAGIRRVVDNRDLLRKMSANARGLAGEFTFKRHVDRTMALYKRVIEADRSKS